ncbi:MAG: hypothetical protein ACFFCW_27380 [Candidatus Hodarchaeota archaeon]
MKKSLKWRIGILIVLSSSPFLVLFLFILLFWYNSREPRQWTEAYNKIQVGMTVDQVEKIMDPLLPQSKSTHKATWHRQEPTLKEAKFYIYYRGRRNWQYRIYFNEDEMVVGKGHWWD